MSMPYSIRKRRQQMGMTIEALALAAGISPQELTLFENGSEIPPRDLARRIAAVLEVSAEISGPSAGVSAGTGGKAAPATRASRDTRADEAPSTRVPEQTRTDEGALTRTPGDARADDASLTGASGVIGADDAELARARLLGSAARRAIVEWGKSLGKPADPDSGAPEQPGPDAERGSTGSSGSRD